MDKNFYLNVVEDDQNEGIKHVKNFDYGYARDHGIGYDYITLGKFIDLVEASDRWDNFDQDIYDEAFDVAGYVYDNTLDFDHNWDKFIKHVEEH